MAIQVALINDDTDRPSIIIVHRNRLIILSIFKVSGSGIWCDMEEHDPCPITQEHELNVNFEDFEFTQRSH